MKFIELLQQNAYENLDISGYVVDIQGWICQEFSAEFESSVISRDRLTPLIIIEVGSWKGLSAVTMANILKNLGFTDFKIICIDTWLGSPEFWGESINDPNRGGSLKLVNGYPSVFTTFTRNIKMLGLSNNIIPLPLSSIQAVDVLKYHNITADIIYVDAAHEYEAIKQDITAYWKLLNSRGIMIGDDYNPYWHGVIRAVNELFPNPKINHVVWSVQKA